MINVLYEYKNRSTMQKSRYTAPDKKSSRIDSTKCNKIVKKLSVWCLALTPALYKYMIVISSNTVIFSKTTHIKLLKLRRKIVM